MRENFQKAIAFVLKYEGGYVNDPDDPGGETNFGISKRAFPNEDIKGMTRERAGEIYLAHYWIPAGCDQVIFPDDVALMDTAVNCGVYRARRWYWASGDWRTLLVMREEHYAKIIERNPKLKKFLKGWTNRVNALMRKCREWEVMG